jgi:hypothetical protein
LNTSAGSAGDLTIYKPASPQDDWSEWLVEELLKFYYKHHPLIAWRRRHIAIRLSTLAKLTGNTIDAIHQAFVDYGRRHEGSRCCLIATCNPGQSKEKTDKLMEVLDAKGEGKDVTFEQIGVDPILIHMQSPGHGSVYVKVDYDSQFFQQNCIFKAKVI